MKKYSENLKIIIIMLVSTFFISFIILITSYLFKELLVVFNINDINGSMDTWISSVASISGGALAFGGVWWTIKNQEKTHKEDLIIQYKPILQSDTETRLDTKSNRIPEVSQIPDENGDFLVQLNIKLKNVGRGELYNGHVEFIKCTDNVRLIRNIDVNQFIYAGNSQIFGLDLIIKNNSESIYEKLKIKYTYKDMFHNVASVYINLSISIYIDEKDKIIFDSFISTSY